MKRQTGDRFARSVCLIYISIMMITNNVLGHNSGWSCKNDWEDLTTTHMASHMAIHEIAWDGSKIPSSEVKTETGLNSGGVQTLTGLWNLREVFLVEEFKAAFMKWIIWDNITLRQSLSQWLRKMFDLVNKTPEMVLHQSDNTIQRWIMAALAKKKLLFEP